MMIQFLVFMTLLKISTALEGYDCGRGSPNITTISLKEVGQCEVPQVKAQVDGIYIELFQKKEHEPIFIRSCLIIVEEKITKCDWFQSVNSDVHDGYRVYIYDITRDACDDLHKYGYFKFYEKKINEVRVNSTKRMDFYLAGEADNDDGECYGGSYDRDGTKFTDVLVRIHMTIKISEYTAIAKRETGELILPSGIRCSFESTRCRDIDESYLYWNYTREDECKFSRYSRLYHGLGARVHDELSLNKPIVYFANNTGGIQFALARKEKISLCGYKIYATEDPRLFISEYKDGEGFRATDDLDSADIILTTYFNNKLSYLSNHIRTQFESMYIDTLIQRCQLERKVIESSLLHIYIKPDIAAMNIMRKPGYMIIPAGEVAHLMPCQPLECRVRDSQGQCFEEIPVVCRNESFYLKPISHVLTKVGTLRDCNQLIPVQFEFNGNWQQFNPGASLGHEPQILRPSSEPTWRYQDIEGLFSSGIYRKSDLEKLRDHSMFPAERPALLEAVARKINNRQSTYSEANLKNLLDFDEIERIAESKIRSIWNSFIQFGSISAGIMSIIMIIQIIRSIIDIIIQGYTLHAVLGWGMHLLGAVLGSLTHLIIHLNGNREERVPPSSQDHELQPVIQQCVPESLNTQESQPLQQQQQQHQQQHRGNVFVGIDSRNLSVIEKSTQI